MNTSLPFVDVNQMFVMCCLLFRVFISQTAFVLGLRYMFTLFVNGFVCLTICTALNEIS